jgi:Zn-dependent peptidase ImmA (M78 family)
MASILKELELVGTIPVNIERLIKGQGIYLNKNAKPDEIGALNGARRTSNGEVIGEIRRDGDGYQILILGSDHYYRKRFTMAHELGHFILHKNKLDKLRIISDSDRYQAEGITSEEEAEANEFAANILMPEDKIREIFAETMANQQKDESKTVEEMSKMFQVSPKAMKLRLYLLDLIENY